MPIAARLFGGMTVSAGSLMQAGETSSTEELHATVDRASDAFRAYLALGTKDVSVIEQKLATRYPADKAAELALSVKNFATWFHAGGGREGANELTNISMDLLIALRDVAGLNWGGTEMSHVANGDFMHFDCRNTALGHAVYAKLSPEEERAQPEAAKRAKPGRKKK
jgi:hypothetical protein